MQKENNGVRCHDADACCAGQKACPMPSACGLHQTQGPAQAAWLISAPHKITQGDMLIAGRELRRLHARVQVLEREVEARDDTIRLQDKGIAQLEDQQAVQLPEPVAFALEWTFNGEERGMRLYDDETHCRFDAESDGGVCNPLYTEQQVRALLVGVSAPEIPKELIAAIQRSGLQLIKTTAGFELLKLGQAYATPEWIANLESSPVWSEAVGECIKKFLAAAPSAPQAAPAAVAVPAMTQIRALHINKPEDDGKRWREVSSGRAAQLVSDNPGVYQTRQLFAAASAVDVPMVDMTPPALPATEDSSTGDLAALIKKFRAVLTAEIHASIDPSSDIARQEGAIDTADHLLAEFNKIFPEA